jgi:hypothetical protein
MKTEASKKYINIVANIHISKTYLSQPFGLGEHFALARTQLVQALDVFDIDIVVKWLYNII